MALINEEKKFIFFHLFKCAGSSMRKVLTTNEELCYEYFGGHCLPRDGKELMYKDKKKTMFNNYFKFTFVRNPFDWLLSTYNYILAYPNHINHEAVKSLDLAGFIQHYVDVMMLNEGRGVGMNKCVTMYDFITDKDGKLLVDFVGKFENVNKDMEYVLGQVGIPYVELPFVNVNPSRVSDYRVCYNEEAKDLVEKYFEKDLDYFNYRF